MRPEQQRARPPASALGRCRAPMAQRFPRRFERRAIRHARRARRLTRATAETTVEMRGERVVVERERAVDRSAHEHDAAARRIVLVAEREIGGTRLQAEAAVHALHEARQRAGERSASDAVMRRRRGCRRSGSPPGRTPRARVARADRSPPKERRSTRHPAVARRSRCTVPRARARGTRARAADRAPAARSARRPGRRSHARTRQATRPPHRARRARGRSRSSGATRGGAPRHSTGSAVRSESHTPSAAGTIEPMPASAARCARTLSPFPPRRTRSAVCAAAPSRAASAGLKSSMAHGATAAMPIFASSVSIAGALSSRTASTSVSSASGIARSRTLTSVITPSVPHAPVSSRVMSKPATFFTTRPPARMTLPSPVTASRPSTMSRGVPNACASGPADAVAIVAPRVPRASPNGSSAQELPLGAGDARDLGERRACARGEREVARHVLDDAGERADVERRRAGYRPAGADPRASAYDAQRRATSRAPRRTRSAISAVLMRAPPAPPSTRGTNAAAATFPGFARRAGSNTSRRRHCASSDAGEKMSDM